MLFNSYEFIFIFLPISFFIYFYLNKKRLTIASKSWLIFASLAFYSWWNISYLPLILISILFNYTISQSMISYNNKSKKIIEKKRILQIGLVLNIAFLGYFKYMDFFIENINWSLNTNLSLMHLALPLAISFFTLQQIAFLIDSYEGLVKEKNLLDYIIFVTFFPQLIAGPIVHHQEIMPQFASIKTKVINYKNISIGLFIFTIGLFKKVVIADTFAPWANMGFDVADKLNFFEAWMTSLSYTFQLYFDFSGYTDMAIGAALLFNIKLPINFNSPLRATGIIDYWQRWHITLTNFITTYVYTPILRSFNKVTFLKAMLATFIAMLISGIWHGAGWTFIIWGILHGIALIINHYWKKSKRKINKILAWFITFNFINITMVIFRAKDIDDIIKVLTGMFNGQIVFSRHLYEYLPSMHNLVEFGPWLQNIGGNKYTVISLIVAFLIVLVVKNTIQWAENIKFNTLYLSSGIFMLTLSLLKLHKVSEFLYFNF